ncbi:cytidylyltransferase domain-containing protein [Thalassospira tepidiphila]|uniref:cytidylyltransferase domain-containing protein n=1 Tax=Thalassospira tepidiphila TaxID=393657 RepID=UPI003AA81EFF
MSKQSSLRIVASVEARMGSSRLPGKVLCDICGKPAIIRLLEKLKKCQMLSDIVVATSDQSADDQLADLIISEGYNVFRGREDDVLDRVVKAHMFMNTDIIVEVTGDCPLIDPDIIDQGIRTYLNNKCDVVSNTAKLSFPQGADVQVFSFDLLRDVALKVTDPAVREHVSLYFYENPEKYNIIHLQAPTRWFAPAQRLQLDYQEDLDFIREVYEHLLPIYSINFGVEEILQLLKQKPEISKINSECHEKQIR